jgi:hypothetical protein
MAPKRRKTIAAVPRQAENEEQAIAMAEARALAHEDVS